MLASRRTTPHRGIPQFGNHSTMKNPVTSRLLVWAEGLRFPSLAMITAGLFVADVLIPDFIPFVDEILLGLATLLLTNLRQHKSNEKRKP